jgi:hypothetical protein
MQLPKLTLVSPKIQSADLFPALELLMSSKIFEEARGSPLRRDRGNEKPRKTQADPSNLRYRSFSHCHESLVNYLPLPPLHRLLSR